MRILKPALAALAVTGLMTGAAFAETTKLRIQTHYAPETVSGKLAAQFVDDVQVMSNGEIQIEMFYASSVVKSVETFDAAATGILDCDMTGGAYQTGKNPAFQFVGDIMGGYDTPYQQLSWLYHGDGFAAADKPLRQIRHEARRLVGVRAGIPGVVQADRGSRRPEGLEIPFAPGPGDGNLRQSRRQADRDGLHGNLHRA